MLVVASRPLRESQDDSLELMGCVFLDTLDSNCMSYLGETVRAMTAVKEVRWDSGFSDTNARAISKQSCSDTLAPGVTA